MRLTTPLALLALTSLLSAVAQADDLFSEIAVESVFGESTKAEAATSTAVAAPAGRVTGAGQLGELLRGAGYEPERADAKTVTTSVVHGQWTIPTTLRAAVDRGQVDITMGLATPEKGVKWEANKLLRLLADPDAGGVYFAFDSKKGQIQVRQTLSARDMSASRLGRLLTEMAEFAASRESAWYDEADKTTETAASGTPATPAAATPTPLNGSWIANLAENEAFAIKLTPDGKFALAHVKAGKTTTSTGNAERSGDRLSLVGSDGTTIAGAVSNVTANGFDLTLTGGKKLSFKKAGK